MSAALRILRPGIHATLQDDGRLGHRSVGVPRSGALDPVALRLLNALLRNASGTAAIEMMYSGATIELSAGSARLAVGGAAATIARANGSEEALPAWHTARLVAGDRLRVGTIESASVAYLGVEGGYAIAEVLGSGSTYVAGALGGHDGRALRAGDLIALARAAAQCERERRYRVGPALAEPQILRIMPGPQSDAFAPDALQMLLNEPFSLAPASNRTGLRLSGPRLHHAAGHDLLSEGVATGSIQVPGSGQPVVLLADHPTVGGYPKIATVISADLAAAGRLRIGSIVRFAQVDAAQAAGARRDLERWIATAEATIEP